ncbi:MAG: LamG domain-containing protein [Sphaerochaeta sp.]|nr:MAG: LamG domain-containing protein [Sphaerochaeta sp.]
MSYVLTVGGIGKSVQQDTLRIDKALTYQVDTCKCTILSSARPSEGDEVIVTDSTLGVLFGGVIIKVKLKNKDVPMWEIDCNDYTELLDRRLVVESYTNMSASDIFLDIASKYCPGFTVNGVQPGAPMVEATGVEFDYKPVSECFRWLCDYVGWHWQTTVYKDLQFFSPEDLASPAPLALIPGGPFHFENHVIDIQGLRNRVYVRGGTMLTDPQTLKWKADGVARIWTLPWPPHEVSLSVGDVPMSVGVENLHEDADFAYMMSYADKYIRCSSQTATPVEGATISLTAKQDIPVISMYEDYASQTAIAAVQGGDGVYEHVIDDDTLTTIQAAEAAGLADLREHANPKVSGSFETEYVSSTPQEVDAFNVAAIGLNGIDSYIRFDEAILQSIPFTIEFWVKPKSPTAFSRLFIQGSADSAVNPYVYYRNNKLCVGYNSTMPAIGVPIVDGEWQHFAWVYDGVEHKGYINGVDASTTPSGTNTGFTGGTYIGRRGSGNYFSGELDDVRIWQVARTPGQIADNYRKMVSGDDPDLVGYWRFDGRDKTLDETGRNAAVANNLLEASSHPNLIGKKMAIVPWQPGQLVDIQLPDRGAVGTYLIQRVTLRPVAGMWTYSIQYGGRLFGIADFLKALVSSQQKKKNIEPAQSIQKYVYGEESLGVSDELFTATKDLPYVYGAEDAICGLVVLSSG